MSASKPNPESDPLRKASLFCPECSRSAPAEEGWSLTDHDGRTDVSCPDCETVLISQPDFDSERRSPPIAAD